MSSIFLKIFWGYILTKVDIRIYIDIFVDPIGYYLIYTGIKQLVKDFPIGNILKIVSFVLIFYSLPSVVIDNLTNLNWIWYYHILIFLDIILVFYLFQLIIEIAKAANYPSFEKRSFWTGTIYFINYFVAQVSFNIIPILPFNHILFIIVILLLLTSLVLEIMFLVLMMAVRNLSITLSG